MFYLTKLLWYEYVSSQSLHAQCDDAKRCSLWEVIGHESGGFHEWDQCSSKRDLTELPSPFYLVRTQQEVRSLQPRKRPSPNPDLRLPACKLCCLQATQFRGTQGKAISTTPEFGSRQKVEAL